MTNGTKPRIIFFARGYQTGFYPLLISDRYEAVFVTLTLEEKRRVEARGQSVAACFEEEFDRIEPVEVPENYLRTSFVSDRFLGRFDYAERIELLGKEITFWRVLFDRFAPVAVMNEIVAIEISEVLLIEAERSGIDYLAPMHTPFDGRFYWIDNPMTLSGRFIARANPGESATAMAAKFVQSIKAKDYTPFYVRNVAKRQALLPLAKAIVQLVRSRVREIARGSEFHYENMRGIYAKRVSVFLKTPFRRYDRMEDIPEGSEVIYYPLHQEPEATLAYMSEFYSNQAATIENILKALAPGQILVVKEHPIDPGSLLQEKHWRLRQEQSGLLFLPGETPSRPVIGKASRIVTLASTVGLEGILAGKAVYLLGEAFYDALPGVRIEGFAELRQALRSPAEQSLEADDVAEYIAGIVELSHSGNPFESPVLFDDANVRGIVDGIIARLEEKGALPMDQTA